MFDVYSEWISPDVKVYFASFANRCETGLTCEAGSFSTYEEAEKTVQKLKEEWENVR